MLPAFAPAPDAGYRIARHDMVFSFPTTLDVIAGESLTIEIDRGRLKAPVLAVRLMKVKTPRAAAPKDDALVVSGDGGTLTPTITRADDDEIAAEFRWPLGEAGSRFRLEAREPLKMAVKVGGEPFSWAPAGLGSLRPNPFLLEPPPAEIAGNQVLVDYYFRGAYKHTYRLGAFGRCTRPDDFMVLHVRPGRFARPAISVRVTRFNHPTLDHLEKNDWVVSADGGPIQPRTDPASANGEDTTSLVWPLAREQQTVLIRQRVPVRFDFVFLDGEKPGVLAVRGAGGDGTSDDSPACFP